MKKLLVTVFMLSCSIFVIYIIAYKVLNVTQPDLLCVITSEEAKNCGIDFNDEDDLSERVGVNEDYGIGYKGGSSVRQYVKNLGYGDEIAQCSFALQGYSIVRFEPQQFHGVYLTLHVKKEESGKVFFYHYAPRYASAWFLRKYHICE